MADGASMLSSIRDALYWAPPWLSSVAVLLIAVICALVAHRILFVIFGRAFGDRHPFLRTIVWQTKGPLALHWSCSRSRPRCSRRRSAKPSAPRSGGFC
jgi:hypothetical protein